MKICKNCKYWNSEERVDPCESDCGLLGCSDGSKHTIYNDDDSGFDLYFLTDHDFYCQYFEEK